ncbi:MAG: hypothetical protein ACRBI6_22775 [Acidimicrobiales bacterium]
MGVDVFETVVVRRLLGARPVEAVAAHRTVAERLWPRDVASFLRSRDRAARAEPGASLRRWFEHAAFDDLVSPERAVDLELEVERQLLRPVPGADEAIDLLRSSADVTFVSDMHHGADDIRCLLEGFGLVDTGDRVVVSSENGTSKSGGGLFRVAFPAADRAGVAVPFIGNNPWSDVTRAAQAGLEPVPALLANGTRFEAAMAARSGGTGPAVAGASRLARLGFERLPGHDTELRSLGAQTVGQLGLAFLLWVRDECRNEGISTISFLARDGKVPLELARAMPGDHWDGVRLEYLHCGRKSWSLAAAPIVGVAEWIAVGTIDRAAFLLHSATTVPFSNLLDRVGLTPDQLSAFSSLGKQDPQAPLEPDAVGAWRDLLQSGDLDAEIEASARPTTQLIGDFLRQCEFPAAPMALVDVGWRGQQAWLISALVEEAVGHAPIHLHFGGDNVLPVVDELADIRRFALDDRWRPHPVRSPVICLETLLAPGTPRLVGYRRAVDGRVEEVFEDFGTAVATTSHELLVEGALATARQFPADAELVDWGLDGEPLVAEARELLRLLWAKPTRREAELLGELHFENDDAGALVSRVVAPYHPVELLGRDAIPRSWREGSLRVTATWFRPLMKVYFTLKDRKLV